MHGQDRLDVVLAMGMAKDPARRPRSASQFAHALRAALAGDCPPTTSTAADWSDSSAPADGSEREHPADVLPARTPGRTEPLGPDGRPPRVAAALRVPAPPAGRGPDTAAAPPAVPPAAPSRPAAAAVRRGAGWLTGRRPGSGRAAKQRPPRAVRVSGGIWCALAAAGFAWTVVDLAGGVGSGLTDDDAVVVVLAVLLGGPPLCAPLLFRRGHGRTLVAVCAVLATWAAFWARGQVLGYSGALRPGGDVQWFAHAVPSGAAAAALALLCSLTPAGFVFFRGGPGCGDPDCDGSDCPARPRPGPSSVRPRPAPF